MANKNAPARPAASKEAHVVPAWGKKVKAYREEAGKTQVAMEKAIGATVNTMSLVENGKRQFTPAQRDLFFEIIGRPVDDSIPAKALDLAPAVSAQAKPEPKSKGKSVKPAKPAKAPKAAKVAPIVPVPAEPAPPVQAEPASTQAISPVKEAVIRDISRMLGNPCLNDSQAKRLHGLFTSLAVNALLGE